MVFPFLDRRLGWISQRRTPQVGIEPKPLRGITPFCLAFWQVEPPSQPPATENRC